MEWGEDDMDWEPSGQDDVMEDEVFIDTQPIKKLKLDDVRPTVI
jgi:hypothetical protein